MVRTSHPYAAELNALPVGKVSVWIKSNSCSTDVSGQGDWHTMLATHAETAPDACEVQHLWYSVQSSPTCRRYVLVHPVDHVLCKVPLLDHDALAVALQATVGTCVDAQALNLTQLDVTKQGGNTVLTFRHSSRQWQWNNNLGTLEAQPQANGAAGELQGGNEIHSRSIKDGDACKMVFRNHSSVVVALWWVDPSGVKYSYGEIEPGVSRTQSTYVGHCWLFEADGWACSTECPEGGGTIELTAAAAAEFLKESETDADSSTDSETAEQQEVSPDSTVVAILRDDNVTLERTDGTGDSYSTTDGTQASKHSDCC